jgi:glycosyltransferase involved in cell wall biosynthesis
LNKVNSVNIVVNNFPAPSETFLFNLVTGLEKKGFKVTVIAHVKSLDKNLYKDNISLWSGRIKYLKNKNYFNLFYFIFCIIKNFYLFLKIKSNEGFKNAIFQVSVFNVLTHNNPDIIHFSYSGIAVKYLPIIDELNKKSSTLVSCRGTSEKVKPFIDNNRKRELSELFLSIGMIHCVSEDIFKSISPLGLDANKAFINKPAVILSNYKFKIRTLPKPNEKVVLLTTGRLNFQKGYIYSLLACKILIERNIQFEYHILGDGPEKNQLIFLISELGLNNIVHLHGKVSSKIVNKYLDKANIFILPSIYEGISNAALEAMAMGVPIISTNAGGMDEVVQNGINGFLVDRFDYNALANGLIKLIENYDNAIKMAESAHQTIINFHNLDFQINLFMNKYSELYLNKKVK